MHVCAVHTVKYELEIHTLSTVYIEKVQISLPSSPFV